MNGYQGTGAGSPFPYLDMPDTGMDFTMHDSAYYDGQYSQIIQSQPTSFGSSPVGELTYTNEDLMRLSLTHVVEHQNQSLEPWPAANIGYRRPFYGHHWSTSTHSSMSSNSRSSDNSVFSQFQNRASTVSTDSSLSNISNVSRSQYLLQTEHSLNGYSSSHSSIAPSPGEGTYPQTLKKRVTPRAPAPEKDFYKTCVSRKQRARPSNTVQKYFCTVCRESFGGKADWIRHEETYQERPEEFQCDLCCAKYFLNKDFVNHHVQGHGCVSCHGSTKCTEKKHVQEARRSRISRTGWGCGFCYFFSTNWTERCNHIANHFEKENKTMKDWNHSVVIYSLLQRPAILTEWSLLLQNKKRKFIGFGWDSQATGRVEGYPDSNKKLQLQDALEFFHVGDDASALALKAYDLAVKKIARERPTPPDHRKDYRINHKASLQDIMKETESWTQFINSVIDDERSPTGVTHLENGSLNDASRSWFDTSS